MTHSYTYSETATFTVTHARHMAAKVATDLKRMQRLYGAPNDTEIARYEAELVELMKAGYLDVVTYGYRRDNDWVEPTLRYTARELSGVAANDDDPGRIRPGADIGGASFYVPDLQCRLVRPDCRPKGGVRKDTALCSWRRTGPRHQWIFQR